MAVPANVALAHRLAPMDPVDYASIDIPAVIQGDDGQPCVNDAKYDVKWAFVPPEASAVPSQFPLALDPSVKATGTATSFVDRPGVQGGDVEFVSFMATSDGRFSVVPYSQTLNMELVNAPIANNLIFGKAGFGSVLPVSLYEPSTGSIDWNCQNLTALANNVKIVPAGRRFLTKEAQDAVEARRAAFITTRMNAFWVTTDDGPEIEIDPGVKGLEAECSLPSNGDFLALCPVDDSSRVGGGPCALDVQILDGISGYALSRIPIPWQDFCAAVSLASVDDNFRAACFEGPFGGLFSHIFARSGKIIFRFTSRDAAVITARVGFRGILLRYKQAPKHGTNTSDTVRQEMIGRSVPNPLRNIVRGGGG